MSRLRADLLLLLTAIIWGTAFIAQKTGMDGIGPMTFIGARFVLSFLFVLPFIRGEMKTRAPLRKSDLMPTFWLCFVFVAAVFLQHFGIIYTTVTNAGFLTGLYVIFVPFCAWVLFRQQASMLVCAGCGMAIFGVWLLNGTSLSGFTAGDWLVIACAFFFALHLVLTGRIVRRTKRPLTFVAIQYGVCAVMGLTLGFFFEGISWDAIQENLTQIAYAGIVSGGVAYTLQAVAQQYTPSSDAAIILSSEALFAALGGALLMGDHMAWVGWTGCAFILGAILLVELGPGLVKKTFAPAAADR